MDMSLDDMIIHEALEILKKRVRIGKIFANNEDVTTYLRLLIGEAEQEVFYVFYLDTSNKLLHHEKKFTGSTSSSYVYPREIIRDVVKHNATAIIIAHNHPGGVPKPSTMDYDITRRLMQALEYVDCTVLDHIVVTMQGTYSMENEGTLPVLS